MGCYILHIKHEYYAMITFSGSCMYRKKSFIIQEYNLNWHSLFKRITWQHIAEGLKSIPYELRIPMQRIYLNKINKDVHKGKYRG